MATCPICKSAAEEIEPGRFDGKTYRCPMHREFEVADFSFADTQAYGCQHRRMENGPQPSQG